MLLFENRVEDFMMARRGNFDFLPHLHHNLEILVCTEGAFGVSCCGKSAVLHRGDLMIAFSNQVHAYQDIGPAAGIMMIVNPRMFPLLSGKLENRSHDNFLTGQGEFYISLAEAACREYEGGGAAEILTGYLYVLLGSALRSLPSQTQKTVLAAAMPSPTMSPAILRRTALTMTSSRSTIRTRARTSPPPAAATTAPITSPFTSAIRTIPAIRILRFCPPLPSATVRSM